MTRVLQPQRDIDREKGREREREREREKEGGRERAGSSVVSIETLYCKTNILKMYFRQVRQVVSRQYITSTKH